MALYGAETWMLRVVDQKHVESFEMWSWRRMEKISWTDDVRNDRRGYSHLKEEALDRIKWRNRFGRGCGPVV
jgi:hypothetical protein